MSISAFGVEHSIISKKQKSEYKQPLINQLQTAANPKVPTVEFRRKTTARRNRVAMRNQMQGSMTGAATGIGAGGALGAGFGALRAGNHGLPKNRAGAAKVAALTGASIGAVVGSEVGSLHGKNKGINENLRSGDVKMTDYKRGRIKQVGNWSGNPTKFYPKEKS